MFNVTVINIKDIIKYLVGITIAILVIVGLARYFYVQKEKTQVESKVEILSGAITQSTLLQCLDATMPAIEETNKTEQQNFNNESKDKNILQSLFQVELATVNAEKEKEEAQEETQEETQEDAQESTVEEKEEAKTGEQTEVVTKNPIAANPTNTYGKVQIKNSSKYSLTKEMLEPNIEVNNKNIVIFHTHTCESYTPTEESTYKASGTFRTTDLKYSVAGVGDELTNYLTQYGYNVVHDKTYHDYPAYTGSYQRSLKTVENILKSTKADVVIDLHRDAIGSKSDYAPTVKIGEDYAAQMMFVVGTNGGGLWHPNWNQNLKFAVKVQQKAEEMYPGLFKPIILRNSRYNQHVSKAATIIEVGATGNTLEQCKTSMKYLSKVISEVMK